MFASTVAFAPVGSARADVFGNQDGRDLGNLLILDQLFDGGLTTGVTTDGRVIVVEPGDTLSGIAAEFLGDASRFPEIASLNNIANPNLIFPGQQLVLPAQAAEDRDRNGLFNNGGGLFNGDGSNLGDLIILDELFGNGGGVLDNGDRDLGDLIILDQLFRDRTDTNGGGGLFNGGLFGGNGRLNLGDLIILDELFDNRGGVFNGGAIDGGRDLGDLIILDQLFGNNGEINLGDLIILDELFN